jgi:hypothetical protein
LLFVDEADAMQRTDGDEHEPIKLERRLDTLKGGKQDEEGVWRKVGNDPNDTSRQMLQDASFWGPQACVHISATLLPVFMRVNRESQRAATARAKMAAKSGSSVAAASKDADPPAKLYPFYTTHKMDDYVGVMSEKWLPFTADVGGVKQEAFLPKGALTAQNMGMDDNGLVMALYKDAVDKPHSLLLDVTVTRVNAKKNVRLRAAACMLCC